MKRIVVESCYSDPKRRYAIWLQSESFVWSVWFIRSVWVNQTNETNQIDEIDRMSQAPKSAQV
jgi:hypothetical protein